MCSAGQSRFCGILSLRRLPRSTLGLAGKLEMHLKHRRSFVKSAGTMLTGAFGLPTLAMALQETASPYRRPKLKITDVKTTYLQNFHVRIYTDQGLTGDGEAVDAISGAGPIVAGFRFSLLNQDPLNIEAIWERIRTS